METHLSGLPGGRGEGTYRSRRRRRTRLVQTTEEVVAAQLADLPVWTHAAWTQTLSRSDESLDWLMERRRTGDYLTGLDAGGWSDSTWILHSFYEAPVSTGDPGRESSWSIADDRPEEAPGQLTVPQTANLGGGYTYQLLPPAVWERRSWAEVYSRFSLERPTGRMPPGFWSFPGMDGDWPETIWLPPEGSMAEEDFTELMTVLDERSGWPHCSFYFASYLHEGGPGNVPVYDAMIRDLPALIREGALRAAEAGGTGVRTPANIWPPDRSWLVYTDYELWATKVSGSTGLINSLRDNPFLETFDWTLRHRR
ncbi:hypothetical protein [Arthrobacter bambusae]|uniref:Uncharacterized protein n=1 Tax=Arthrobacter bambusae TaxID=1338426 RepID=A0AAW8DDC0_9MICC|nr:hypothetical protein [Arthrobacter bambusae]MDP9904624.1 hypothetical protein [Arthrobacter bambusae]MDQ0129440.1 hypothetical protein [Arthrobacter bambusae]MDQ0180947.1 hypothetical protein [Arthrobacter bambusae]